MKGSFATRGWRRSCLPRESRAPPYASLPLPPPGSEQSDGGTPIRALNGTNAPLCQDHAHVQEPSGPADVAQCEWARSAIGRPRLGCATAHLTHDKTVE